MQEQKDALSELELKYQKALKDVQSALKKAENPDARRLLNRAHKAKSDAKIKEQPKKELNLKVGLSVKYKGMQASVISIKSKEVLIEANGMKLRVPKSELRAVESTKKVKKPKPVINVSVAKPQNSKISLKLLGYRADEAEEEVHNFLSNALLQGFSEIEIIHGSGAGVLSKVVSELLKKHPKVKSFERVKGNLGATIVKL
jgi:DNA mismatch repair protein MutS2